MSIVRTKFIFRRKEANNEAGKFKARVVAQGFSQIEGIDYQETFSGVVDKVGVRLCFHVIASRGFKSAKFDVTTAFLNATLSEDIYVTLPAEIFQRSSGKVHKLKRALYGLKQSPRAWQKEFSSTLSRFGFIATEKDPCLYVLISDGTLRAILGVHVDDGLLGADGEELLDNIIKFLESVYKLTFSMEPNCYLALEAEWHRNEQTVVLRQSEYIAKLAQKFEVNSSREVKIPMDPKAQLFKRGKNELQTVRPYRELIGALIYVSTCTRPDVAFAVNRHAQYFADATDRHFDSALKILAYLNSTRRLGLRLGGRNESRNLAVYADADFAGDEESRNSVTGNCIYYGDSLISWTSKKQKLIATSSTEAEFLSAFYSLQDLRYVDQLIHGIFPNSSREIIFYQDNQSCIALIKNESSKGRSKHFDVKLKAVSAAFHDNYFDLQYLPTELMIADILTKPLSRNKFSSFRPKLVN